MSTETMHEDFKAFAISLKDKITEITKDTPYAEVEAVPDHDIFTDIRGEVRNPPFWHNFKAVSPIIFNYAC